MTWLVVKGTVRRQISEIEEVVNDAKPIFSNGENSQFLTYDQVCDIG